MTDRSTPATFLGAWRIEAMELWARDAIDLVGPSTIVFEDEAFGEFRFIAVRGWMDCRFDQRDGKPLAEFSWCSRIWRTNVPVLAMCLLVIGVSLVVRPPLTQTS